MQPNKIMYIDLADPLPKSYAPKKGEEMNRSTYSTMRYSVINIDLVLDPFKVATPPLFTR